MNTLGERLKWALDELRLSEPKAARLAGVSKQAINKMISGETKSSKWLLGLSEKIEVNYNWLLRGEGEVWSSKDKGDSDLMAALTKIEERWKIENDYLREQLKIQNETIRDQASTIAAFTKNLLKFKATVLKPLKKTRGIVKQLFSKTELEAMNLQPQMHG